MQTHDTTSVLMVTLYARSSYLMVTITTVDTLQVSKSNFKIPLIFKTFLSGVERISNQRWNINHQPACPESLLLVIDIDLDEPNLRFITQSKMIHHHDSHYHH